MAGTPSHVIVPSRFDFKAGDVVDGKYRIDKHLGDGSFGAVYKVQDILEGKSWAMKLLRLWDVPSDIRQPLVDRFEMEFKTGRIPSRHLVHSVDYGYANGNPYIVMEFCSGGDLTKVVGSASPDIPRYAHEILSGLDDLHKNGKVHRDLKPENVLIKEDGKSALTDFGISGDRNKRMTERNIFGKPYQIFGTYAYMPPEQVNRARGESTVLPTTDIFSFGVVVYQMLTGVLPFGRLEDQNDLVYYQKKSKAGDWDKQALRGIPMGYQWEQLIAGCLEPDYRKRIQTASQAKALIPGLSAMSMTPVPEPAHSAQPEAGNRVTSKAAGPASCRLRIAQGEDYGMIFDLEALAKRYNRRILTVGRSEVNMIQLREFSESYTSRRHFTLEMASEGEWIVRDGQWNQQDRVWTPSTNGTFVGSTPVPVTGIKLNCGDVISAGDIKMIFEI